MPLDLNTFNFKGKDIVFLLGAGASVDAGVKNLTQIMTEVETLFAENNAKEKPDKQLQTTEEIYFYFKKNSIKPDHLKESNIEFGSYNIEDILSNIRNVIEDKNNPAKSTYTSIDRALLEIIQHDYSSLGKAYNTLSGIIIRRIIEQTNKCENKIEYLFYLFFLLDELNESINVFTLNFDLIFECAHKRYQYLANNNTTLIETGFRDSNIFMPGNLEYVATDRKIYYHKLHGSLNWKMDAEDIENSDKIIEIDEEEMQTLSMDDAKLTDQIIFGTSRKYRSEAPYTYLYGNFVNALKDAKMLVVVGYSFTDRHINDVIKNALNYNENLYVLNVAPNVKDTTRSWLEEGSVNSVRISSKIDTSSIKDCIKDFDHALDNKEYYDTLYVLKMYTYSRNFDEDALYLCRLYYYYLNKSNDRFNDVLKGLGVDYLSTDNKIVLNKYVDTLGNELDEIFSSPIPADEDKPWDLWSRLPYSNFNADSLIKKLKDISAETYGLLLHSTSPEEKIILSEFSNKIKILLFFYEKFLHRFLKNCIQNLKDHYRFKNEQADDEKIFLLRLRMIEQLILANYLVEYVKIWKLDGLDEIKYPYINTKVNEINKQVEQTYFHRPAKKIVGLLKYDDALKINGSLPKGNQISKFNRETIRIVGPKDKEIQSKLRLKSKLGLGAFIDKNNYLRSLINLARNSDPITFTTQKDWHYELLNDAKVFFTNDVNNFVDDDLVELLFKINTNLTVYNKIFNDVNKKTLELFLNSNIEQKRIDRNHFKGKVKFKNDRKFHLRKNTAENFFTNELRLRNLLKYYSDYYLIFSF